METPSLVTRATWYCRECQPQLLSTKSLSITHLVDTPGVAVVEHLHAVVNDSLGLLGSKETAVGTGATLEVDASLGLVGFTEERLGNVGAETGSECGSSVGRAEEIDVAEEGLVLLKVPAADEAGVPQGVNLVPPGVEQVGEESVQVVGGEWGVGIGEREGLLFAPVTG